MFDEILEKMDQQAKRRSAVIWSAGSIAGYVWDIIRNLIVVAIILGIYFSFAFDATSTIIISVLIMIYLNTITICAQLSQSLIQTNFRIHARSDEILKKLGKEKDEESEVEFEKAGFMLEKAQYKFILNSVFNFIIFLIALVKLLSALSF